MAQQATYPLTSVKALINDCIFTAPTKSTFAIMAVKRVSGKELTVEQAEDWIKAQLANLTDADFCRSFRQWEEVADEYGKIIEGQTWYIKFMVESGVLESISFHPAERPMTLQNGTQLKEGNFDYDKECKVWRVRE